MLLNLLCIIILGSLFVYSCYTVLYRLFYHPLARFPGPKCAAATKWYEFYFDLVKWPGGTFMYEVERMHEEYGPIVRINPDELHIKDTEWVEVLYTGSAFVRALHCPSYIKKASHIYKGLRDKYPPAALMLGTPQGMAGTIDHHVHRKRRAAITPIFSKTIVASAEPIIHEKVELLGERLKAQFANAGIMELRRNYLAMTTDIICQHAFDMSLNMLQNDQAAKDWQNTINAVVTLTPWIKQFTWIIPAALRLPLVLLQMVVPAIARLVVLRRDIDNLAHEVILSSPESCHRDLPTETSALPKGNVSKTSNIFRSILSSQHLLPEEKQHSRIAQEGFVVMVAGGETTAQVLTVATFHLLKNKATALAKLKVELGNVMVDPNARVDLKTLEKLPWLVCLLPKGWRHADISALQTAVVKESLRIAAIVTSRLPLVSPKEPLRYLSWEIPSGTPVSMTLRDVLLDPAVFENPMDFVPERWLSSNPNLDRINKAYVPFGRGGRMCIGVNLALTELYIIIACLFRRFDFDLHDTIRERDIDVWSDLFVGEPSPESLGVRVKGIPV